MEPRPLYPGMKAQPVRPRNAKRRLLTLNIGKNKQFESVPKSVARFSD
jgi:hypothetical protein